MDYYYSHLLRYSLRRSMPARTTGEYKRNGQAYFRKPVHVRPFTPHELGTVPAFRGAYRDTSESAWVWMFVLAGYMPVRNAICPVQPGLIHGVPHGCLLFPSYSGSMISDMFLILQVFRHSRAVLWVPFTTFLHLSLHPSPAHRV